MNVIAARKFHGKKLAKAHRLTQAHEFDQAERIYRAYCRECPDDPQVNFNMGVLIQRKAKDNAGLYESAEWYEKVICSPVQDTEMKAQAMNNFGLLMMKVDRVDKALGCFQRACLMWPELSAAHTNHADCLRHLGEYQQATEEYEMALELKPDSAEAHFAIGMLAIMMGDLERGFREYEWRWKVPTFPTKAIVSSFPRWDEKSLNGNTILLTQEQGWGDQFMFIRYAGELKRKYAGCKIWVYCGTIAMNVLRCADGVDDVFDGIEEPSGKVCKTSEGPNAELHSYDFHFPLLSLPMALGTTLATIPASVPYIHCAHDNDMVKFGARNIALVWRGSPKHGKDKWRSIEPEMLQPLIDAHPECQFYSLQVGPKQYEVKRLKNIVDLAPMAAQSGDWTGTAQILQQIDLLISVDTACVHLAGALGRPVWMLTPHSPDFRWILGRDDCPWYPTLRLFRQQQEGDWQSVIERVNHELFNL